MTVPLAHTTAGSREAPALLMLHPIATHRAIWDLQLPILAQRFHVLLLDLPGHGASAAIAPGANLGEYADRVLETLDVLGLDRIAILGLSFGGMVAQAMALKAPERFSAMVLAHTAARTAPVVRDAWTARLSALDESGMAGQVEPTLDRWFTPGYRSASSFTMNWVGAMINQTSEAGYRAAVTAIQGLDHLDILSRVTIPTLVISGSDDHAVTPAVGQALADAMPRARFAILPGAAHIGNVEQPTLFAELAGGFLVETLP